MSKSSRSMVYHRQLPHCVYNFQKMFENFPKFCSKEKKLTRKILNLGEYCICWNVILKIISFIPQTCVEVAKVNYSCIPGKYTHQFSFPADMIPASTGPETLTPDNLRRLRLVFFNDVFFNASCGFLLRLRFCFVGFLFLLRRRRQLSAWPSNVSAGNTRCSGQA